MNKVGWRCGAVAILNRNVVSRCGAGGNFVHKVRWRCGAVAILDRNVFSRCGVVNFVNKVSWRCGAVAILARCAVPRCGAVRILCTQWAAVVMRWPFWIVTWSCAAALCQFLRAKCAEVVECLRLITDSLRSLARCWRSMLKL